MHVRASVKKIGPDPKPNRTPTLGQSSPRRRLVIAPNLTGEGFQRTQLWSPGLVAAIMRWCDVYRSSKISMPVLVIGCPSLDLQGFMQLPDHRSAWGQWCDYHGWAVDPTFSIFTHPGSAAESRLNFHDMGLPVPIHVLTQGYFAGFNNRDEAWREYLSHLPLGKDFNLDRWNTANPRTLEERFIYGDACRLLTKTSSGSDCLDEVVILRGTSTNQAHRFFIQPKM